MKKTFGLFIWAFFFSIILFSQDKNFKSIHRSQSEYYNQLGLTNALEFDSLQKFSFTKGKINNQDDTLVKRVFGYFPYWAGSNYLNYQWDLLSDLCFFSYEVDPVTGNPLTVYDWDTSPAIDSAFANNVNVHLCVTLFSGHYSFFENLEAQQTLITNIISLIQNRGAHGVNMDVEALPSSLGDSFTDFLIDLTEQMSEVLPEAEISIAAPAVNWSGTFDIPVLSQYIDFFMVMGYDYYWNGSSQAGSVSPLYSMVSYYDYNFSKTISYYQSQGVPHNKLVLGVPYYARQWPTQGQFAPSATNGYGTAYTYRYVKTNSSGYYSSENMHLEPNSFSPYYSFQNNGWIQCFIDNVYSLGKKYDQVNRRNLAGIGIWALGYDDGYIELWELIANKFTESATMVSADTIFDTGGSAFNYYDNENYSYTVTTPENTNLYLSFSYLNLEEGYDSLCIFDGPDIMNPLIGEFSGDSIPLLITASGNSLTLKFYSDNGITNVGWRAVYDTLPVSSTEGMVLNDKFLVYPNPASNKIIISLPFVPLQGGNTMGMILRIFNSSGQLINETSIPLLEQSITLSTEGWKTGLYYISLYSNGNSFGREKLIVK